MSDTLTLRIGSYNLAAGRQVGRDMRVLGNDIRSLELDIVGVQEVDQFVARSGRVDTMRLLAESAGLPYYAFFPAIDLQGGEYGIGILSRYPITRAERHELSSFGHEQRVLGRAEIDVQDIPVRFFVTHLCYEAKKVRTVQFAEVAELVRNHAPYVLVGDFNTADYTAFSVFAGTTAVNNEEHSLPTFAETRKGIDNIIYTTDAWHFTQPAMLANDHSDHRLLYAEGTLSTESFPL